MSTEEQQRPPVNNDIDNRAIGEKLAELTELMASFEEVGALDRAPEEGSAVGDEATGERATQMDAATGEGDVHREVPPELTTRWAIVNAKPMLGSIDFDVFLRKMNGVSGIIDVSKNLNSTLSRLVDSFPLLC
jgi:hypothetical protein